MNHEGHERSKITKSDLLRVLRYFVLFVVRAGEDVRLKADTTNYGLLLAEKLNEMPPEMARLVLFESSGLESVRPTPT